MSLMQAGAVIGAKGDQNFAKELLVALKAFEEFLQIPVGFRRYKPRLRWDFLRAGTRGEVLKLRLGCCLRRCF